MSLFVYIVQHIVHPKWVVHKFCHFLWFLFSYLYLLFFQDEKNRSRWQQKSNLSHKKETLRGETKSMHTIGSGAEFLLSSRTRTRRFSRALESVRRVPYSLSLSLFRSPVWRWWWRIAVDEEVPLLCVWLDVTTSFVSNGLNVLSMSLVDGISCWCLVLFFRPSLLALGAAIYMTDPRNHLLFSCLGRLFLDPKGMFHFG